jgi:general secretion pathway protein G
MKKRNQNKENGFTLVELLVVIAIIAILSTVVMAGLNSARQKGRDAKRVSDIKQLQKALDLYSDTCDGYPMIGPAAGPIYEVIGAVGGLLTTTATGCATETFGTFMAVLPVNILPGGTDYGYCSTPDGAAPGAASCDVDENVSYQATFTLEGTTGSLAGGVILYATPSGITP